MNEKGWIRIVEAFMAVLLVAGVMLAVYSKQAITAENEEIIKTMSAILDEVVNDNQLRTDILSNTTINVEAFVKERIPSVMDFKVRICEINAICGLDVYHENTYARERIVSSILQKYDAKKLKLFLWEK